MALSPGPYEVTGVNCRFKVHGSGQNVQPTALVRVAFALFETMKSLSASDRSCWVGAGFPFPSETNWLFTRPW